VGVKAAGAYGWKPYHLHVPIVLKSGSLIFLEPSGPAQACNGIALPLPYVAKYLILQYGVRIPSYQRAQSNSRSLLSFCATCMNYKCCFFLPTVIGWRRCQLRTNDNHDFTPKSVKLRHDVNSYRPSLPSTVRILRVCYTTVDINP